MIETTKDTKQNTHHQSAEIQSKNYCNTRYDITSYPVKNQKRAMFPLEFVRTKSFIFSV